MKKVFILETRKRQKNIKKDKLTVIPQSEMTLVLLIVFFKNKWRIAFSPCFSSPFFLLTSRKYVSCTLWSLFRYSEMCIQNPWHIIRAQYVVSVVSGGAREHPLLHENLATQNWEENPHLGKGWTDPLKPFPLLRFYKFSKILSRICALQV